MRVAHLSATFPPYPGGAGTTCLHLSRGLAARGHEVDVFTAPADGPPPDAGGARVHRLRPLVAIGNAPLLPGLARLRGFQVVHLHYPFIFGTELALLARLHDRRAALVVSYHNRLLGQGGRRPLFRAWEETWGRALLASADRICALSESHAESVPLLRSLARHHPERLAVLPNGVDTARFRPSREPGERRRAEEVRATHGIPADAVVAAFVATLDRAHYFKRLDLAIEAVARARHERLHLLVVGAGELLERYRAQAVAAGVGERVHFAGTAAHDLLPDLLRAADVLLLASDPPESFGIVLIEAMASGLPTVSTDYPGARAVVEDGVSGIVVPRADAAALAGALSRTIALGPAGRERMGRAGRAICEQRFAWPRLIEPLESLYRAAVAARTGTPGGFGAPAG